MRIYEITSPPQNSQVTNTDILIHNIIIELRSGKQINQVRLEEMKQSVLLAEKSKIFWIIYDHSENFTWLENKISRCKKMLTRRGVKFDNNSHP
jgi:hypothetical protein